MALEMLGRSELNLTTLSLLAPLLTTDTLHLLDEARFKSKQRVLELIAKHAAKPDVPDSIRRIPRPGARAPQVQMAVSASAVRMRSPALKSMQIPRSSIVFTGKPMCVCTTPLGFPVVPDV